MANAEWVGAFALAVEWGNDALSHAATEDGVEGAAGDSAVATSES